MKPISVVAVTAVLAASPAYALERSPSQAESRLFVSTLQADHRVVNDFDVFRLVTSLDFEAGSPQAIMCGQMSMASSSGQPSAPTHVALRIRRDVGTGGLGALHQPMFGSQALSECKAAGVRMTDAPLSSADRMGTATRVAKPPAGAVTAGAIGTQGRPELEILEKASLRDVHGFSQNVGSFLKRGSRSAATEKAKASLARSLKDPESARFRDVSLVPYQDGAVICGEVNAKNSYGGYVGYKRFVASTEEFLFAEDETGRYAEIGRASNAGLRAACGV